MIKEAVKKKTLSEQVVAQIKTYIIEHDLKPEDRLPTEQEFSELLGVSRTSIREATKALSFLGIIRSSPKVGLTVGKVDMERVSEYLGFHFALNNYSGERLLKARMVIEIGSLADVMERMKEDPKLYDRLKMINDEHEQAQNHDQFIRCDVAFHRALVEASDIEPLVTFSDLLQVFFHRFRKGLKKEYWKQGNANHGELILSLRDGNLPKAEAILRKHLVYHRGFL
jgi:GntR family transcriptional repressor for pyruvate dehydrogenase complex